jgi:hypothetical protein
LDLPIIVFTQLQSLHQHGIGLDKNRLAVKYKEVTNLDLSHVEEDWNSKDRKLIPYQCVKEIQLWLKGIGDHDAKAGERREILIVGHGSWFYQFTEMHGNSNAPVASP